jgi:hypothetical protein
MVLAAVGRLRRLQQQQQKIVFMKGICLAMSAGARPTIFHLIDLHAYLNAIILLV